MSALITVGIDPGVSGAVAILGLVSGPEIFDIPTTAIQGSGRLVRRLDFRTLAEMLADRLSAFHPSDVEVWCEDVILIGTGVNAIQTMSSQSRTLGGIEGVFAALGFSVQVVVPQTWKRVFGLTTVKEESRRTALQLYPDAAGFLARVKDHDRAESLLIAHWGSRFGAKHRLRIEHR